MKYMVDNNQVGGGWFKMNFWVWVQQNLCLVSKIKNDEMA